jgi:uncharacterized protein YecT (DUF1311 family)
VIVAAALLLTASWTPPPCPFHSKAQLDECAEHDLAAAERDLTNAWQKAMRRLKAINPQSTSAISASGFKDLAAEQKAWRAWRDAHCAVVSYGLEHTSVDRSVRLDCMTGMTRDRIKEIEEMGRG